MNEATGREVEIHVEPHSVWFGSDVDESLQAMAALGDPDVRSARRLPRKEWSVSTICNRTQLVVGATTALASSLALPAASQLDEPTFAWHRRAHVGDVPNLIESSTSTLPSSEFSSHSRAMSFGSIVYLVSLRQCSYITAEELLVDADKDLSFLNSPLVTQYEASIPGGQQAIVSLFHAVKKAFPWVAMGSVSFEEYADDDEGWSQLALVVNTGRPLDEERMAREDIFYATVDDDPKLRAALSEVAVSFR